MALFSDDLFDVFEETAEPSSSKGKKRSRDGKEKSGEGRADETKKPRVQADSEGAEERKSDSVVTALRAETEEEAADKSGDDATERGLVKDREGMNCTSMSDKDLEYGDSIY